MSESPTIEDQVEELLAAGWTKKSASVWVDPRGNRFRGPHGAWEIMRKYNPYIAEAVELRNAWRKYVGLFGEPPHGTLRQMSALLALTGRKA